MNVSIVIPNYNGEKLLEQNLPKVLDAVKTYKKGKVELIVTDDPSTDNSRAVIKKFGESVKYKNISFKSIENRSRKEAGFSKNVNRGTGLATGDILVLLNTDVIPHVGFLEPLVARFAEDKMFAVGCMDQSKDEGGVVLRGRGLGEWKRGFLIHRRGEVDKNNTLWVSGGSSAFRMKYWQKLGGLDPLFNPFYWEDIDISYRGLKSGYLTYFEPRSIVNHEHQKGAIRNKFKQNMIRKITYRNQFIFVWKNITDGGMLFSHFAWLPYHLFKALIRRDWAFFAGLYLALIRMPRILYSRTKAQKYFVKKDIEVLKDFRK